MFRLPRPAIAGLCTLAAAVLTISLLNTVSAQVVPPAVATNKTGYLAGETVVIGGVGFTSGDVVTLRVMHADGTSEAGGNHDAFTAVASDAGEITASWALGAGPTEDLAGNEFVLTASTVAGALAPVAFSRIAVIATDKFDYQPDEYARIDGAGFRPAEVVTVRVEHSNGRNDGNGHGPSDVVAGSDGTITLSWHVDPDDSLGSIFRLTAIGADSGLVATSTFTDLIVTQVDDDGPDDEPGQKDLNQMSSDLGATAIAITWNWDDTDAGSLGGNTNDACALLDTNQDGFANFAFCVVSDGNPARQIGNVLYTCNNTRSDRCAGQTQVSSAAGNPATLPSPRSSSSSASVVANTDPFRLPPFNVAHSSGNDCDTDSNCLTHDTVANVTLQLSDVGGASVAKLLNVCSYPSQEPNSDPSDCVVTPDSGFLTIKKTVENVTTTSLFPGAFTFNASAASQSGVSSWSYSAGANGTATVVLQISYAPGSTLDLNEVLPTNEWKLTSAACVLQAETPTTTGDKTSTGVDNLTIQTGLETICTFTNTEDTNVTKAKLTLVKNLVTDNGGTAVSGDFTLSANGPTPGISGVSGADAVTNQVVDPGNYTLSETQVTGYTASNWTCTAGTLVGDVLTLAGGHIATCTITNDDNAASLTLNKVVVNDSGGSAAESAWTLTANGGAAGTLSGAGAAGDADVVSGATFKAGTYVLSEDGPAGYTGSAWVCTGTGTQSNGSITLALGQSAVCTITNDDNAPSLTLNKVVVNDSGGSAAESAWTLTANGGAAGTLSGAGAAGDADVVSGATFKAGTYVLSEDGPAGYTGSAWVCTGTGTQSNGSITLALGQSAVCTITNDDNAPSLTLNKVVVNNNGGSAAESAWTLTANGGAAGTLSGAGAAGDADVVSGATFKAGTYALSEDGPAGYTGSAWVCTGTGTQSNGSITLALGQSAVCTITNDDNAPSLTLNKVVVNNNGGSAAESAWALTANGGAAGTLSGAGAAGSADVVSGATFKAGTYALSEDGPAGYTGSAWVCTGTGTQSNGSITLALGQSAVCTITNDDNAPSLTLNKVVVNNNGGSAAESAWALTANGGAAGTLSGAGAAGDADVVSGATFKAGTYALSEDGPAGYTGSAWVCTGTGTQSNGSITLALGQSAVCTITNDDNAPSLTLNKVVVNNNGGSAAESAWALTANGGAAGTLSGAGAAGDADVVSGATFKAGTYALSEDGPAGYTGSAWVCTGTGTQTNGSITLALGQSAVCTITNNDNAPSLTLNKVVVNDNGGSAAESAWALTANGGAAGTLSGAGAAGGADVVSGATFKAGTYALSEDGPAGYTGSAWVCTGTGTQTNGSITLALGQSAVCTITNDDNAPSLTLVKVVDNTWCGAGCATTASFTLTAANGPTPFSGNGPSVSNGASFDAGTYTLSETNVTGYSASAWSCVGGSQNGNDVTLGLGQSATCTITNTANPAYLTVIKSLNPTNDSGRFNLRIDGTVHAANIGHNGTTGSIPVMTGIAHSVSETAGTGTNLADYVSAINTACSAGGSITLQPGGTATCTITNTKKGIVTLNKLTNGVASETAIWNFTLNGTGLGNGVSDSTPPTDVDFGGAKLVPGDTYTICETPMAPGWTLEWKVDTDNDGVPDTIIPFAPAVNTPPTPWTGYSNVYDPNYVEFPGSYVNDTRCVKFTVNAGQTLAFEINNSFPGGEPRTIGYWKNWNTCTGGNQAATAAANGGPAAGWYILDNLLNVPGYHLGPANGAGLQLDGNSANALTGNLMMPTDCVAAVRILDKSKVNDGKKAANDAAYNMAAQLLAALLNLSAGAETCTAPNGGVVAAVNQAQTLLMTIGFNGTGSYLTKSNNANFQTANSLAGILDQYNNGFLCTP